MPFITLHLRTLSSSSTPPVSSPLPPLLHTPSGLAILELQGTLHLPTAPKPSSPLSSPPIRSSSSSFPTSSSSPAATHVGHLTFPLFDVEVGQAAEGAQGEEAPWMKRVYLYVGGHQRLTGEVKRLGRPVAVVRRRRRRRRGEGKGEEDEDEDEEGGEEQSQRGEGEELEIVDVVRYKIVFAARPEPVGGMEEG